MLTLDGNAQSQTTRSLQRLAKMFAALSATNEAILRTKSADELYQQVCGAALSGGNLLGAAILLREPGTDQLRFVAGAGNGIERLRTVDISVAENAPTGQGITGVAFRTAKPCVSNDLLNDIRSKVWREALRREGIRAAAALPLVRGGASVGVLLVFFAEVGAADDEIVSLLARMVENVVFALDDLDSEAERKKNERAARRLARMYAALSATNEAIIRSKSPQELYERICDASVRGGKSIATAVLLAEPDSPWLKAVAGSGDVMELVKITRFSTDPDSPLRQRRGRPGIPRPEAGDQCRHSQFRAGPPVARSRSGGQCRRLRGGSAHQERTKHRRADDLLRQVMGGRRGNHGALGAPRREHLVRARQFRPRGRAHSAPRRGRTIWPPTTISPIYPIG